MRVYNEGIWYQTESGKNHHCKLDTGKHNPKMQPELQVQSNIASGLAAQNCQFDSPCDELFQAKENY